MMDYYADEKKTSVPTSVLQSDDLFSSKILARQSTIGSCSSRMYHRDPEGVPFKWEMEPGRPITPPPDHILPPISPPPAVLAMGLPKPCIDVSHEPKAKRWSRAWLLKNVKKRMGVNKVMRVKGSRVISNGSDSDRPNYELKKYHSESCRFSSSSLVSTSRSSSRSSSNGKPSSKELSEEEAFTCRPWGFGGVVVYLMKRP